MYLILLKILNYDLRSIGNTVTLKRHKKKVQNTSPVVWWDETDNWKSEIQRAQSPQLPGYTWPSDARSTNTYTRNNTIICDLRSRWSTRDIHERAEKRRRPVFRIRLSGGACCNIMHVYARGMNTYIVDWSEDMYTTTV